MADEHTFNETHITTPNRTQKEKKRVRIFVRRRKRISSGVTHKSTLFQTNSMEQLTSLIEKKLNIKKKKKNIIIVNYKPVFRQQKSTEPKTSPPDQLRNTTTINSDNLPSHSKSNRKPNQEPVSLNVPDVEDPFMFIEMMYQQLFTEDGQLRSETEPEVLANCVKQIVTNSRRNSMVQRDLISPNIPQRKFSSSSSHHFMPSKRTSVSSSPYFVNNTFSEEDEPNRLLHANRDGNISRRNSKRLSMDNMDHQFHAFLNSYHHRQRRVSKTNRTSISHNYPFSIDDTDNEDLDTFSDLNSYRKNIRTSPPASIDEDITNTDSKLFSSSGYQSLKSPQPIIQKIDSENDHHHYCPNCTQIPVTTVISPMNIIQPIRDTFVKCCHFILISKNVLVVPLIIFLFHQRSMYIDSLK